MFYSHEVLTSRKYGVATVWLVATLGSKTSLKKVSRKAILDVDIEKTCQTIAEPTVPMALRLQSSLLFGVTRVYSQQCGYVLADVENARNDMRMLAKVLRTSALAEGGNKGRAEHLMLRDDPTFLPEIDFDFSDLNIFDNDHVNQHHKSSATSLLPSTRNSHNTRSSVGGSNGIDFTALPSPSVPRSTPGGRVQQSTGRRTTTDQIHYAGYEGLQEDLGLNMEAFDLYDLANTPPRQGDGVTSNEMPVIAAQALSLAEQNQDSVISGVDDGPLHAHSNILDLDDSLSYVQANIATTTSSASAPLRRTNAPGRKVLPVDHNTQLGIQDLKNWDLNYVTIMEEQQIHKSVALARSLAKDNARYWFYGNDVSHDPLADFRGVALLRVLDVSHASKRERDEDGASETDRRVRSRQASDAVDAVIEDDMWQPNYGDVEIGREQPTPLQDSRQSALMPWSQGTGPIRPHSSVMSRVSSSAGGGRLPSLQPRASQRLTTASPLGHQVFGDAISIPHSAGDHSDGFVQDESEYKIYGPAGQVDTQTAGDSQWLRTTLDDESMSFLAFVTSTIKAGDAALPVLDAGATRNAIGFIELLPPSKHTAIVAAQAFLHVLTLSTRGYMSATQIEPADDIELRVS